MPTIKSRTNIAAAGVNGNLVAGNQFEFLSRPSNVKVYARQAYDAAPGLAEVEVFLSSELALPQCPITIAGTAAEDGLKVNQDLIVDTFGDQGDRLVVRGAETAGAQDVNIDLMVVITPVM